MSFFIYLYDQLHAFDYDSNSRGMYGETASSRSIRASFVNREACLSVSQWVGMNIQDDGAIWILLLSLHMASIVLLSSSSGWIGYNYVQMMLRHFCVRRCLANTMSPLAESLIRMNI